MSGEIIIFKTAEGKTDTDVKVENETVWLTQGQMADLFQKMKQNISLHIKNIFAEGELDEKATVKDYLTVQNEGNRKVKRKISYYNLDVIISVGYRIKSTVGTQFRMWATQVLKEYMVKGFSMNDRRLKESGGGGYWKELLARIRDICSSEKVFYRQILDIYATSLDYDKSAEESARFFKIVQNKMHFTAHEHTAAEIEFLRADASKPFAGLKSFDGQNPHAADMKIAKNYLNEQELDILNGITSAYLEFAAYKERTKDDLSQVEKDYIDSLKTAQKRIERQTKGKK